MESIGRLAGGIAHDFNNMLTSILGNLGFAEMEIHKAQESNQGIAPEQVTQYLTPVRSAAERGQNMVRQLLGYSRKSKLDLRPCDANEVVMEICEILRHAIDPRIQIGLDLAHDLWLTNSDATQILQVFMNLAVNARDAMPEGGVITIRTRNTTFGHGQHRRTVGEFDHREGGDFVAIEIRDDGEGISPETLDHIFEPFFTTKSEGHGTGLGLSMSIGIVEQHGGWMACESEVGEGSAFTVYLPRLVADLEPSARAESIPPAARRPRKNSVPHILVVDDDMAVARDRRNAVAA